jgi:ribonuclease BN (tRNA processing enzyme)
MQRENIMKTVFLGTVGFYPTEKRHTSCVFIKDLNIIIDAGSGFFRVKNHINSDSIHILLSHYHMDHISGLTQLVGLFKGKRADIYGSKGVGGILKAIFKQPYFPIPLNKHPFEIKLHDVGNSEFKINGAVVKTQVFKRHTYPVVGYRIECGGKLLTYIKGGSGVRPCL